MNRLVGWIKNWLVSWRESFFKRLFCKVGLHDYTFQFKAVSDGILSFTGQCAREGCAKTVRGQAQAKNAETAKAMAQLVARQDESQ